MSDYLKLDNQLCFPLYALSRQITNIYRPILEKLGLTYPQYLVLMVLWEYKTASVKSLGERLWLDSGTLTPLLKRMEASELIRRERSTEDERLVNVTITEKGLSLESLAESIPGKIKCKIHMEDSEIVSLRNYLKKILLACAENK
ncbi:MAG: MarR family transcriptional regulator [Bacteroidetes bacterium]|jgi:MarR family transcriptional regulator, organic hydroperoxide resistance regulator|nr:MarR family transcriptional regulator [Bacteroidota bacterium]